MDAEAIIIGTGFGAAVAATKLAEKLAGTGNKVIMLERGLWWFTPERPLPDFLKKRSTGNKPEQPVQYWPRPNHRDGLISFLSVVRTNSPLENLRQIGDFFTTAFTGKLPPQPLYRYHLFPDIHIVTASGVGGGSLIYSNVTIEPKWDPDKQQYPVMENWPVQLNQDDYTKARAWMEQNRGELHQVVTRVPLPPDLRDKVANLPAPYDLLYLWKSRALKHAAEQMGAAWEPLDLALIEFVEKAKEGTTKLGDPTVQKTFCERQARCFLGCLPGARHTLNKTLLNNLLTVTNPLVSLRSLAEVDHIRSLAGGGYEVVYRDLRDGSEKTVSASKVILAAGCLGSTELLLRSRAKGTLTLSDKLGGQFSSNGDFAGFVIVEQEVGGKRNPVYPVFPTRGPINTSHAMFQDGKLHMTIEDGAIPPMFASVTGAALSVLDNAAQRDAFMQAMRGVWIMGQLPDLQAFFPLLPDPYNPKRLQTEDEMVMNIFFFNCMGTDDAKGKFELDVFGNLKLSFPEGKLADHPVFQKTEGILKAMAEKMGGRYVPFPLWQGLGNRKIVTVHPLGGCPMGNSSTDGVVDMKGRVFKTRKNAKTVHDGLYVMDASIIPGPLAVNPTLTIVALALKIAEAL